MQIPTVLESRGPGTASTGSTAPAGMPAGLASGRDANRRFRPMAAGAGEPGSFISARNREGGLPGNQRHGRPAPGEADVEDPPLLFEAVDEPVGHQSGGDVMDDDVLPFPALDGVDRGQGDAVGIVGRTEGLGQPRTEAGGVRLQVAEDHQGVEVVTMRGHRSMAPPVERSGALVEAVGAHSIADLVENVDRRARSMPPSAPPPDRPGTRSTFWASRSLSFPSSQAIRRSNSATDRCRAMRSRRECLIPRLGRRAAWRRSAARSAPSRQVATDSHARAAPTAARVRKRRSTPPWVATP